MSRSLAAGLYPDAPGSHQIFGNAARGSRQRARRWRARTPSIVVGLGEEGKLRAADLVYTVRQAVIAWAQRAGRSSDGAPAAVRARGDADRQRRHRHHAGSAAQLIAQGVREANEKLHGQRLAAGRPPDAGRALPRSRERGLARAAGAGDGGAEPAQGGRQRRRRAPARCAARSTRATAAPTTTSSARSTGRRRRRRRRCIAYTLDTKRARTEVRAQQTQAPLLRELVAKASNDAQPRPADRPHAVPPAGAGRDGAVPRRHHRDAARARRRHRRHPVGAARHQRRTRDRQRPAAVGDPQQAAAQAAHRATSAPRSSDAERRRQRARDRRAACATRRCTRRCPARAPRRARWRRGSPAPAAASTPTACARWSSGNDDAQTVINALFERR